MPPPTATLWLTDVELAVLGAVSDLARELGRPPKHREVAARMGYRHTCGIARPVRLLRSRGMLQPPGRWGQGLVIAPRKGQEERP